MSQVTTLYADKEKTDALYPRTKVSAISDDNNKSLQDLLDERKPLVSDVQLNGASIVTDNVANIPFAKNAVYNNGWVNYYGVVGVKGGGSGMGAIQMANDNTLIVQASTNEHISKRYPNVSGVITSNNYDYAVKCAMTDGKGTAWTADEQAAARERMGIDDTITTVYAGNMYSPHQSGGYIVSTDKFNFSNCYIINIVVKNLKVGNIYNCGDLLNIYQDESNYLSLKVDSYTLVINNVKDGTTINSSTIIANNADANWTKLINTGSYAVVFDYTTKKLILYTLAAATSATRETIFSADLSSWDLTHLQEFDIRCEYSNRYDGFTALKYFHLNTYLDYDEVLARKLDVNNFSSVFPVQDLGNVASNDFYLSLGGTVTETVDNRHKIATYNVETPTYFAIGVQTDEYQTRTKMTSIVKVKFSNITSETKLSKGAGGEQMYIYDEDLNLLASVGTSGTFTVEADKWYILTVIGTASKTHTAGYLANFAWYLQGTGTVEAIAIALGYERNAVCAALNYNGAYFTGPLPFLGTSIKFLQHNPTLYTAALIPLYSLKVENGVIYMFNGSEWKQITA